MAHDREPIRGSASCPRNRSPSTCPTPRIADLKTRLALTRFPDAAPGDPWAFGTSVDYAKDLVGYWKDHFDWRAQEAASERVPAMESEAA